MTARDNKSKWLYVARRAGMSPEAREEMEKKQAPLIWTGFCRKCKKPVKGTIDECRAHKCEEPADVSPSSTIPGSAERPSET